MSKSIFKHILVLAFLSSAATFAFAEDSAPVYDADNYPPQFDGSPSSYPSPTTEASPAYHQRESLTLDQRVARAEQQINNIQKTESSSKIDALQNEVQSLRGEVEQLTHQLQQVQNQQRTMYSDFDKRLSKQTSNKLLTETDTTETKAPAKIIPDDTIVPKPLPPKTKTAEQTSPAKTVEEKTPVAAKTTEQPNVAEEQQIYQTAYNLIKVKKYNEAVAALQKMLQKYPSGQFAANAHYWLGELYGLMNNNEQSGVEFATVVRDYPESPKVSDAQLKLGLIYAAAFKWPEAKTAFKKVINHYPGTASARLAAEQLKQIKEAGH